ncbi:receptor-like protein kinase-related family protein [Actinidia rufa]|uniref:Receptor-like protein kinase-related family protein n=1 Tax=Actinidia rufa TaxID=165716 RepID=A0A7J0HAS1_9ERIC|nr:receptor-like protein kinase-related family protein [Actinidia rufa]
MGLLSHVLLFLFLFTIPAKSADPLCEYCNTNTNISSNQTSANIEGLLSQLVSGTILNGYIATSNGKNKDQVYGLAQCRADVGRKDCSTCIQDTEKEIQKRCPNQADARIWYDFCFLRHDIKDFFGEVDTGFGIIVYNVGNVTNPETFNKELTTLTEWITLQAVVTGNKGNGRDKTKLTPFTTLYALVQCTRDLLGSIQ